jgi:hypothetical protein
MPIHESTFIQIFQYIGTIGSPISWRSLSPNKPPPHNYSYRMPPDLKNVVSETTLKVLEGGNAPLVRESTQKTSENLQSSDMSDAAKLYQRIIQRPIVKKDAKSDTQRRYEKPTLDISLTHVSLLFYCPLKLIAVQHRIFAFRLHYRFQSIVI